MRRGEGRTELVGIKYSFNKGKRAGLLTVREAKRGSVHFIRTERTYKYVRADWSRIWNSNTYLVESFIKTDPCANGQRSCTVVPHKNGRFSNKKWDHDYCRVSSRGNEQGSRLENHEA